VVVFLAYAPADREWARDLTSNLARQGVEVWDAYSEVSPGENWHLLLGEALEKALAMVVLVSPAAAESESVRHEIEYALSSERFRNRLIPVIVKPTRKLPWILKHLSPEKGTASEISERIAERLKTGEACQSRLSASTLLRMLRESGLIGMWKDRADIQDSLEFARQLRREAEKRGRSS